MQENCCPPDKSNNESIRKTIREHYGNLAQQGGSCCTSDPNCCQDNASKLLGDYSVDELKQLPPEAVSTSAGCGNPTALAGLREGEVVLDLGSGGGIDVFLAAERVGPTGKTIGVDMTPDMVDLARRNAEGTGLDNVEFRLGEVEHLPVADNSVDVVISNCVINLSLDKDAVFNEAFRVLRSGGRLVVSDIMAEGLPLGARESLDLWASCVGGALPLGEYIEKISSAGFQNVVVLGNTAYEEGFLVDSLQASGYDGDHVCGVVSHAEIQAYKP